LQPHRLVARALAVAVVTGAASAAPSAAATWTVVPSKAVGSGSALSGVDALSATDAWAVGGSGSTGLVERWNGTSWATFPSPNLADPSNPSNFALLSAVDATSASNAVAVGTANGSAVALRFNGTSWSTTTVPSAAANKLNDVQAFSATDAWAVGRSAPTFNGLTLARHWNGSSWAQAPTPSPGTRDNVLLAVSGTSSTDVWAVGWYRDLPYGNRTQHSLVLHWNGSAWSRVASPDVGDAQTVLKDVVALSPTNAWAVGYTTSFGGGASAVALHWNGASWSVASAPALGTLDTVAALSATDIWASGTDGTGAIQLANWRGAGWTSAPAPAAGGTGTPSLTGMAAVAPGTVWAVGYRSDLTTGEARPFAVRTTTG